MVKTPHFQRKDAGQGCRAKVLSLFNELRSHMLQWGSQKKEKKLYHHPVQYIVAYLSFSVALYP